MSVVTVEDVQNRFGLELLAGREGIERKILTSDMSRPGLEMAGYFDFYTAARVQLLGKTEISFFNKLDEAERQDRMDRLCSTETPAFILAHNIECPIELQKIAEERGVPVLQTEHPTTRFSGMLTNYLEGQLAPMTTVHGVLVDVYGIGVLITGKSGVGKSETALELVKRGHRLVADDAVEITASGKECLNRKCSETPETFA